MKRCRDVAECNLEQDFAECILQKELDITGVNSKIKVSRSWQQSKQVQWRAVFGHWQSTGTEPLGWEGQLTLKPQYQISDRTPYTVTTDHYKKLGCLKASTLTSVRRNFPTPVLCQDQDTVAFYFPSSNLAKQIVPKIHKFVHEPYESKTTSYR